MIAVKKLLNLGAAHDFSLDLLCWSIDFRKLYCKYLFSICKIVETKDFA